MIASRENVQTHLIISLTNYRYYKGEYSLETLCGSNIDSIIDFVSHDKGASDSVADVGLVLEVIDEYVTHLFSKFLETESNDAIEENPKAIYTTGLEKSTGSGV